MLGVTYAIFVLSCLSGIATASASALLPCSAKVSLFKSDRSSYRRSSRLSCVVNRSRRRRVRQLTRPKTVADVNPTGRRPGRTARAGAWVHVCNRDRDIPVLLITAYPDLMQREVRFAERRGITVRRNYARPSALVI
jgi:hypothetical protein